MSGGSLYPGLERRHGVERFERRLLWESNAGDELLGLELRPGWGAGLRRLVG